MPSPTLENVHREKGPPVFIRSHVHANERLFGGFYFEGGRGAPNKKQGF